MLIDNWADHGNIWTKCGSHADRIRSKILDRGLFKAGTIGCTNDNQWLPHDDLILDSVLNTVDCFNKNLLQIRNRTRILIKLLKTVLYKAVLLH